MEIQFKKFSNKAVKNFLATAGFGCHDVCSEDNYLIFPNSVQVINTGIGFAIPHGFIGKIFTRSSWALKFTSVEGGVIDSDYRGEVKVICHNKSTEWQQINKGQSIAQIGFFRSEIINFDEVFNFEGKSLRGEKGFGSTDKK